MVGQKKAKRSGSCAASTTRRRRSTWSWSTRVPLDRLEEETVQWCREMLALSPSPSPAQGELPRAEDGFAGIQQLAHDTNLLFYASEEAKEGREAYKAKRRPDFSRFPKRP
jgi:naphthoate synthase